MHAQVTPVLDALLTVPWVVAALERAVAPFMPVGGTGDRTWDPAVARRLTSHVLEFPDADHGLYVPGPLSGSMDVLRTLIVEADRFLDGIGWPG